MCRRRLKYVQRPSVVAQQLDMLDIPEPRLPDVLGTSVTTEPLLRGRIDRRAFEVAQKHDRVLLDEAAQAALTSLVRYAHPQQRHAADHRTHIALERIL